MMKLTWLKNNYTLKMIPDVDCLDISYRFDIRLLLGILMSLISVFVLCIFFIAGYHIKVSQEGEYRTALNEMKEYHDRIDKAQKSLSSISMRLHNIQKSDQTYRRFTNLFVPDDEMYKAGIGGHSIINDKLFSSFDNDTHLKLKRLYFSMKAIDRQMYVMENSLQTVNRTLETREEIFNHTPSILPSSSHRITSGFAWRFNPVTGRREFHDAVDFAGAMNEPIYSTAHGIVVEAGYHRLRGYFVRIDHQHGYTTTYSHLHKIMAKKGQRVVKGEQIGTMGNSGRTTGVNCHYTVELNGRRVNPRNYFTLIHLGSIL
jgi:murein DD-endopeptidase MepM/ murein hydrolase activator NlpD